MNVSKDTVKAWQIDMKTFLGGHRNDGIFSDFHSIVWWAAHNILRDHDKVLHVLYFPFEFSIAFFECINVPLLLNTEPPLKPGDIYSKLHRLDSLPPAPFMCIFLRRWNSDHSKFSDTSALHFKKHTSLKQECSLKLVIFTFGAALSIAVTTKKKSFKSRKPVYQCWRLNRS